MCDYYQSATYRQAEDPCVAGRLAQSRPSADHRGCKRFLDLLNTQRHNIYEIYAHTAYMVIVKINLHFTCSVRLINHGLHDSSSSIDKPVKEKTFTKSIYITDRTQYILLLFKHSGLLLL